MSGGGFGFLLPSSAYEPEDVAFSLASPTIKARFHAEAGRVAARVWDASRAAGLDRMGKPLAPIASATVEARRKNRNPFTGRKPYSPMGRAIPTAPPLTPVNGASRTRAYLRHRTAPGRGVWFWHRFDNHTRHYWGEILARHGRGFVMRFRSGFRFVPPRDVLGFSDAELAAIRTAMAAWWRARTPRPQASAPVRDDAAVAARGRGGWDYGTPATVIDMGQRAAPARPGDGDILWRSGLRQWRGEPTPLPAKPIPIAPMPRLGRARPSFSPARPAPVIVDRVAELLGRRPTRDDLLELALMARQAGTAEQAARMARASRGDEADRWRAVAVLIRSGWRFMRRAI